MMRLLFLALLVCVASLGNVASFTPVVPIVRTTTPSALQMTKKKKKRKDRVDKNTEGFEPGMFEVEIDDLVTVFSPTKLRKMRRKIKRDRNIAARKAKEEALKEERRAAHKAREQANIVAREAKRRRKAARSLKLIISGAPASGKGTQCAMIKEKYGVVHLSTGDMLRAAVAAETEVGKAAKAYMDGGQLVPDDVIIGVVTDRLEENDCKRKGWLLDGFPRTQAQAQALAEAGVTADCFLFLNVPDEVLVERVVGRRTDPETGIIYHMTFSPPPPEVADRLVQRSDDTEEKVKVRLEQFHANVGAVKGSYTDISVDIDGSVAPAEVAKTIDQTIEARIDAKLEAEVV